MTERERKSDCKCEFLHLRFPHKVATLLQNSSINTSFLRECLFSNWRRETINIALPVWFLITTDQDGQKDLCAEGPGNDFGRERSF